MAAPSNPYGSRRSGATPSSSSGPEHIIGKFKKMDCIGKGSFAEVYRGIHIDKRQAVAIKSVNLTKLNKKLKENLAAEISILRSLQHPHIVSLIDCQEAPERMHIIMEFCELGDLSSFIKKRADLVNHPQTQRMIEKYPNPAVGGLNEVVVRHFAKQMASALEFLRSKNYIHRDLKPQNLLLNPSSLFYSMSGTLERMPMAASANSLIPATGIESLPMLKIADFGFARILPTTSLAETLCGSPLYMAPEILRYEKYDAKADLWSVGTVLFEMMCARPPFRANNHVELLRKIEERKDHIRFPEGILSSRAMKNLIRALLKKKPAERMSYDSFFNDPVIREAIPHLVDEDLPESLQASEPEPPVEQPKRVQKMPVEVVRRTSESPYSRSPKDITGLGTTPPSRPTSRPTPVDRQTSSPRAIATTRRASNAAVEPVLDHQQQQQRKDSRRPALPNAATAPGRTFTLYDQAGAAGAGSRRRFSRDEQVQAPSGLKEHLDRERAPQKVEAMTVREAGERSAAAQDSALDEGFVFVEKRRVEIDALADELAEYPQTKQYHLHDRGTMMQRRATTQGSPTSTTGATAPSKAIQIQGQVVVAQRGSYERRSRPTFDTATAALTKAFNMVNIRGLGISPPIGKGVSPPHGFTASLKSSAPQTSLIVLPRDRKQAHKMLEQDGDYDKIERINELANLSFVIWSFANIKYQQLVPITPSDEELAVSPSGIPRRFSDVVNDEDDDEELSPGSVVTIAEEALVLYCKALAFLNKGFILISAVLSNNDKGNEANARAVVIKERLNSVTQWMRDHYADCCNKSEIAAGKHKRAQVQLPLHHPCHLQNIGAASGSVNTGSSGNGSFSNIQLGTGITAEKLLYDRAVEMSEQGAQDELENKNLLDPRLNLKNLHDCRLNYGTAVTMFEAILEPEDDATTSKANAEDVDGIDSADRETIKSFLEHTRTRLRQTQKKISMAERAQARDGKKRASITSAPSPSPGR